MIHGPGWSGRLLAAGSSSSRPQDGDRFARSSFFIRGEPNEGGRPPLGWSAKLDATAATFEDLLHDGEPDTVAGSRTFRRGERFEDPGGDLRRNAGPVVVDVDVDPFVARVDVDRNTRGGLTGTGLDRILQQISYDLGELGAGDPCALPAGGGRDLE